MDTAAIRAELLSFNQYDDHEIEQVSILGTMPKLVLAEVHWRFWDGREVCDRHEFVLMIPNEAYPSGCELWDYVGQEDPKSDTMLRMHGQAWLDGYVSGQLSPC